MLGVINTPYAGIDVKKTFQTFLKYLSLTVVVLVRNQIPGLVLWKHCGYPLENGIT